MFLDILNCNTKHAVFIMAFYTDPNLPASVLETPEYKAIVASFGKLITEVFPRDIGRILSAILTTKIIADTPENKSKIMTGSNHDWSRKLGDLLIDSVETSSGNFHKLIKVLRLVGPWTKDTVEFMTDKCKK